MPGLDESRDFISVGVAVVTVSDTRTEETDTSGGLLIERLKALGHRLVYRAIVADDLAPLDQMLRHLISDPEISVVLTTGGTGMTHRDITPEVVQSLADKSIPGFGELFRQLSYEKIGTSTIQSRALAVVAQGTYIFALPGSTNACRDAWDLILKSQLDVRHRPCNFIELIPRLKA